jgi:hypothetical protein
MGSGINDQLWNLTRHVLGCCSLYHIQSTATERKVWRQKRIKM